MANEKAYGLLINYHYCTGCHSCEVSCQMEHDLPVDRKGIVVQKIGPWQLSEDKWQFDFVPKPTDLCDLCADRTAKGKKPLCVKHCQAMVMQYGPVDELTAKFDGKTPFAVFVPKAGVVAE